VPISSFASISTLVIFKQPSGILAVLQVVVSFITTSQVVAMLPRRPKSRPVLWLFAVLTLVWYLLSVVSISGETLNELRIKDHPVQVLMGRGQADFKHLLRGQSQNFTAAHAEYKRRYKVEPPPGFDIWYAFAKASNSPIIDDFDLIFENISPFWASNGKDISRAVDNVWYSHKADLWRCTFHGAKAETVCEHPYRVFDRHVSSSFNDMLKVLKGKGLPDVTFLVNHKDEPVVMVPPASLGEGRDGKGRGHIPVTDLGRQPTWDALTTFCSMLKKRSLGKYQAVDTFGLPFVTDRKAAMDLCYHPEYKNMHGLFSSPTSFNLVEGLVPILSTGAPSTMGDLLFPSPAYTETPFLYHESNDVEWLEKRNNLYWYIPPFSSPTPGNR